MAKSRGRKALEAGPRKSGPRIVHAPESPCSRCRGEYFYREGRAPGMLRCAACKLGLLEESWWSMLFGLW